MVIALNAQFAPFGVPSHVTDHDPTIMASVVKQPCPPAGVISGGPLPIRAILTQPAPSDSPFLNKTWCCGGMLRAKAGGPLKMCALIDLCLSVKAVSTSPVNWNVLITVGVLMDKARVKRFLKWGKALALNPSEQNAGACPLQ